MADPQNTEILTRKPPVSFAQNGVQPPGGLYIEQDDQLQIVSMCSATGVTLAVNFRMLTPEGDIVAGPVYHTPNTDRSVKSQLQPLLNGYLLSVTVTVFAGTVRRGQCFVQVQLARGSTSSQDIGFVMVSDYVMSSQSLCFPGAPLRSSTDGPGYIRSLTGTDPAANTEFSETVPTNARWKLRTVTVSFVTDANVASRDVNLIVDDGTNTIIKIGTTSSQTAGTTRQITWADLGFAPGSLTNGISPAFPPDVLLLQAYRVRTSTNAIQVGDNYGAPQLLVEEWLED